jgi:hypothetical protein
MSTIPPEPSSEHVKIDSIKLTVNQLTVDLKIESARKLWAELNEIFGPKPATPVYIPYYPTYISNPCIDVPAPYTQRPYFGDDLKITCGGSSVANIPTVFINPNDEPFPEKWQVSYNAYQGNTLVINS